jgi:hypothetical protein
MNYPNELCQLVIRNMEIIETAPNVIAEVEKRLFAAVNARIEKAVKAKRNWEGCYELVTEKEYDETTFAPQSWPKDEDASEDESYGAYYTLTHTEEAGDYKWLSRVTGVMGTALCFAFVVESEWSGLTPHEYKRKLETFYAGNAALQEAGFSLAPGKKSIVRPFHFDADKLAAGFPDFDEALAPLDAALGDLFKAHGEFDGFVKNLMNSGGK